MEVAQQSFPNAVAVSSSPNHDCFFFRRPYTERSVSRLQMVKDFSPWYFSISIHHIYWWPTGKWNIFEYGDQSNKQVGQIPFCLLHLYCRTHIICFLPPHLLHYDLHKTWSDVSSIVHSLICASHTILRIMINCWCSLTCQIGMCPFPEIHTNASSRKGYATSKALDRSVLIICDVYNLLEGNQTECGEKRFRALKFICTD